MSVWGGGGFVWDCVIVWDCVRRCVLVVGSGCKKLGASRESTTGQQILMCIRLRAGRRTPCASSSDNIVIILKWGSVVPAGDPSCSFVFADGIFKKK